MVHIACFNLLGVLTTDVLHVIVDACISDEGIVKCSMIQDKLRRAQERLLNRRLEPNRVTTIMHNIRLIELGFKKLSLVSHCGLKKVITTYQKFLKIPRLIMQWSGFM